MVRSAGGRAPQERRARHGGSLPLCGGGVRGAAGAGERTPRRPFAARKAAREGREASPKSGRGRCPGPEALPNHLGREATPCGRSLTGATRRPRRCLCEASPPALLVPDTAWGSRRDLAPSQPVRRSRLALSGQAALACRSARRAVGCGKGAADQHEGLRRLGVHGLTARAGRLERIGGTSSHFPARVQTRAGGGCFSWGVLGSGAQVDAGDVLLHRELGRKGGRRNDHSHGSDVQHCGVSGL